KVLKEKDSKDNKEFFLAQYSMKDLLDNQLVGSDGAAEKRNYVGKKLGIGDNNAKQFLYRMNRFGINRGDFNQVLQDYKRKD
ncbi:MAG: DUF4093 domain-containing protein, partial [Eubacteriales bacterium]